MNNTYVLKFVWGFVSVGLYLFIGWLLLFYFNTHDTKKSVHYVEKNENSIIVPMIVKSEVKTPKPKAVVKKTVEKVPVKKVVKKEEVKKPIKKPAIKKPIVKKVKPKVVKPKKVVKEKVVKKVPKKKVVKKVVKKEVEKKVKITKKKPSKPKKVVKAKDLFSNVSTVEKPKEAKKVPKKEPVPSKNTSDLMATLNNVKKSDSGIENAYLAKIEKKLNGWPAQSEYAGQQAKVWVKVQPNGSFEYKVVSSTGNTEFNEGLVAYLNQLQNIGFGRHKAKRAYEINVEFVAKE